MRVTGIDTWVGFYLRGLSIWVSDKRSCRWHYGPPATAPLLSDRRTWSEWRIIQDFLRGSAVLDQFFVAHWLAPGFRPPIPRINTMPTTAAQPTNASATPSRRPQVTGAVCPSSPNGETSCAYVGNITNDPAAAYAFITDATGVNSPSIQLRGIPPTVNLP